MLRFPFAILALIFAGVYGNLHAATAPSGTAMAGKQQVVHHIKDESSSLNPIKAVGLVEAQVDPDLFEYLVNQSPTSKAIPDIAMRWQTSDN